MTIQNPKIKRDGSASKTEKSSPHDIMRDFSYVHSKGKEIRDRRQAQSRGPIKRKEWQSCSLSSLLLSSFPPLLLSLHLWITAFLIMPSSLWMMHSMFMMWVKKKRMEVGKRMEWSVLKQKYFHWCGSRRSKKKLFDKMMITLKKHDVMKSSSLRQYCIHFRI